MANSFTFNSYDFSGIITVTQSPLWYIPEQNVNFNVAPFGKAVFSKNYSNPKEIKFNAFIEASDETSFYSAIDTISKNLLVDSPQYLLFDDYYTDRKYECYYSGGLENIEMIADCYANAELEFQCVNNYSIGRTIVSYDWTCNSNDYTGVFANSGSTFTEPIITMVKAGSNTGIQIICGDNTGTISGTLGAMTITYNANTQYVYYSTNTSLMGVFSGRFIKLIPGNNNIVFKNLNNTVINVSYYNRYFA